jgi:hypothetical protein
MKRRQGIWKWRRRAMRSGARREAVYIIPIVPQRKQHPSVTKISWLMLSREATFVYIGSHTKHIKANCRVTG